jgi:hypothetical protein
MYGSAASKQFATTAKAVTKGMPVQPDKLWAWLTGKGQKTLLAILAVCEACTVDAPEKRRGAAERLPAVIHAGQLADALKLDMMKYWQPIVAGYFERVSKELILEAVANGVGEPAAGNMRAATSVSQTTLRSNASETCLTRPGADGRGRAAADP